MAVINRNRVVGHPILPDPIEEKKITIYYNDQPIEAIEGDTIAAALLNAGVRSFRKTVKLHEPRGIFCAIGRCTDCMMVVDGHRNIRTCVTYVKDGMRVETQLGYYAASEVQE